MCGTHGPALLLLTGIKGHFPDHGKGLQVTITVGTEQFIIGLSYIPCKNSKYWDVSLFYFLQNCVVSVKTSSAKTIMMGGFNARTGEMNDYIDFQDNENILPAQKTRIKKWTQSEGY